MESSTYVLGGLSPRDCHQRLQEHTQHKKQQQASYCIWSQHRFSSTQVESLANKLHSMHKPRSRQHHSSGSSRQGGEPLVPLQYTAKIASKQSGVARWWWCCYASLRTSKKKNQELLQLQTVRYTRSSLLPGKRKILACRDKQSSSPLDVACPLTLSDSALRCGLPRQTAPTM